jgi:hypothetical protein
VDGWIGGRHWIDSATLTGRSNLALALLQGSGPYADKLNPWAVANKHGCSTLESAEQLLLDLFLQSDLAPDVRDTILKSALAQSGSVIDDPEGTTRCFARAVVTLPEFQLA